MKPRRVFVTLELETDLPISTLRRAAWWNDYVFAMRQNDLAQTSCEQAQANVVNKQKPKNRKRK